MGSSPIKMYLFLKIFKLLFLLNIIFCCIIKLFYFINEFYFAQSNNIFFLYVTCKGVYKYEEYVLFFVMQSSMLFIGFLNFRL